MMATPHISGNMMGMRWENVIDAIKSLGKSSKGKRTEKTATVDSMVVLDGDLKSRREAERKGAWGMQSERANTASVLPVCIPLPFFISS